MYEILEGRRLFSVTAHVLPGHGLLVQGSSGDDHIIVDQTGSTVVVTDANLSPEAQPYADAFTGVCYLIVHLGNGNDTLTFTGDSSAAAILGGNGQDTIEIISLGTEQVAVDTGPENDFLSVFATGDSIVVASAGSGNDTAELTAIDNAQIALSGGSGNDQATINNYGATSRIIFFGDAGNDLAIITNAGATQNVVFYGGPGTDTSAGSGSVAGFGGAMVFSVENPG
jgi:hypothetical protein